MINKLELHPQKKDWNTLVELLEIHGNTFHKEYQDKFGSLLKEQERWHLKELSKIRPVVKKNIFHTLKKILKFN